MTDDTNRITVECPDCGHSFETHAVGDMAGCKECEQMFPRFTNIVSPNTETAQDGDSR